MKKAISTNFDVLIAGAGPAGMSAAVYTARAGLRVVLLEKEAPGGKMIKTSEIENYPGFSSILGADLAMNFYTQAEKLGAEFKFDEIISFEKKDEIFHVLLKSGETITVKVFIIATGTKENQIGIPGEQRLYGKGVSYCAVCDAAFYKNEQIAVVGGGYSAIEEAIYLTRFASKVYIIHRRDEFRVDNKTLQKAKDNPKIEFILDSVVEEVLGENKVEKIQIKNLKTDKKTIIEVKAIFPLIGFKPNTNFITQTEILDENRNILTDEEMQTSIKGLWAAGDVRKTTLRQIATAVSDGATAGQKSVEYIDKFF